MLEEQHVPHFFVIKFYPQRFSQNEIHLGADGIHAWLIHVWIQAPPLLLLLKFALLVFKQSGPLSTEGNLVSSPDTSFL